MRVEQNSLTEIDSDATAQAEMRLRRSDFAKWEQRHPLSIFEMNQMELVKVAPIKRPDDPVEVFNRIKAEVLDEYKVSEEYILRTQRGFSAHPARVEMIVRLLRSKIGGKVIADKLKMSKANVYLIIAKHRAKMRAESFANATD